jgi:hypothetical protein
MDMVQKENLMDEVSFELPEKPGLEFEGPPEGRN